MDIRLTTAILVGKLVAAASRLFNIGAGSTWSGEVALRIEPKLIAKLIKGGGGIKKTILIAGTNGKTTTAKMLKSILANPKSEYRNSKQIEIIHNEAGANLLNGIAGALIRDISFIGHMRLIRPMTAVFEVDEATLPLALREFTPKVVVILNLFRDQLDRYGEVNLIANKWLRSLKKLMKATTVILNADDPRVAYLGKGLKAKVKYFGMRENLRNNLEEKVVPCHEDLWGDSLYCPRCSARLSFKRIYFSHLGDWECRGCGLKRPKLDFEASKLKISLEGSFNLYNGAAAVLTVKEMGLISYISHIRPMKNFRAAFGRGEEIEVRSSKFEVRRVRILLSKNPTGFNENIRLIKSEIRNPKSETPSLSSGTGANSNFQNSKSKTILLVLNDRVPDGRDVSWIWDVNLEPLVESGAKVIVSGDRAEDMGIRLKYSRKVQSPKSKVQSKKETIKQYNNITIERNLKKAINLGLEKICEKETLYILPTYSAMLEVRKILTGRGIL